MATLVYRIIASKYSKLVKSITTTHPCSRVLKLILWHVFWQTLLSYKQTKRVVLLYFPPYIFVFLFIGKVIAFKYKSNKTPFKPRSFKVSGQPLSTPFFGCPGGAVSNNNF
uniref:Uncharacterized protein n=1 Tax=Cacopsylla melanoneura TaxID=428564 RepID=A0A8D8SWM9_9HEMI